MADLDETPLPSEAAATATSSVPDAESDSDDALLDFRHLVPNNNHALPRRGIKDFEYHGTNSQISVLEGSRQAMHEALSVGRVHMRKNCLVGYFEVDGPDGEEDVERIEAMERTRAMREQRPVMVEKPFGQHPRTIGTSDNRGRMLLLPEEIIYLVERGSLDVQYRVPSEGQSSEAGKSSANEKEGDNDDESDSEGWDGTSMSLQACYANFIGCNALTLERYIVYAALKRSGYIVLRAPGWYGGAWNPQAASDYPPSLSIEKTKERNIWQWLYTILFEQEPPKPSPSGPLVMPGLYRNYSTSLRLIIPV
ncbi:MAG: hypothetical protein Q9169_008078 [Polycauliona sp. 2 TL-2023]